MAWYAHFVLIAEPVILEEGLKDICSTDNSCHVSYFRISFGQLPYALFFSCETDVELYVKRNLAGRI